MSALQRLQRPAIVTFLVLVTGALVAIELLSGDFATFWIEHPFTTALVSGALLLALTVVIVDELLQRREEKRLSRVIEAQVHYLENEIRRLERAAGLWESSPAPELAEEVLTCVSDLRHLAIATTPTLSAHPRNQGPLDEAFRFADAVKREVTSGRPDQRGRLELYDTAVEACREVKARVGGGAMGGKRLEPWQRGTHGLGLLIDGDVPEVVTWSLGPDGGPRHYAVMASHGVDPEDALPFGIDSEGRVDVLFADDVEDAIAKIRQADPLLLPPSDEDHPGWRFE